MTYLELGVDGSLVLRGVVRDLMVRIEREFLELGS